MRITSVNGCPYFKAMMYERARVCENCCYYIHNRYYNSHYCNKHSKYFKLITDKNYFNIK